MFVFPIRGHTLFNANDSSPGFAGAFLFGAGGGDTGNTGTNGSLAAGRDPGGFEQGATRQLRSSKFSADFLWAPAIRPPRLQWVCQLLHFAIRHHAIGTGTERLRCRRDLRKGFRGVGQSAVCPHERKHRSALAESPLV
jgi:hypothetical protein